MKIKINRNKRSLDVLAVKEINVILKLIEKKNQTDRCINVVFSDGASWVNPLYSDGFSHTLLYN